MTSHLDVLTIGRVGVDLYPLQDNVGLEDVETFSKSLGGSADNVAIAAAKHGRRTAVISRTGPDAFGEFVHEALIAVRVSTTSSSPTVPDLLTPVTFCEMYPPDHFPLLFYRLPIAPDLVIRPEELDLAAIADAGIFWSTVTGLSAEPSRSAHHAAWQARARRPHTILDLDYRRSVLGRQGRRRSEQVRAALPHVTVAIGNKEECEVAVGETEPRRAAAGAAGRRRRDRDRQAGTQGRAGHDPGRGRRGAADPGRPDQRPRRRRQLRRRVLPRPARGLGPGERSCGSPTRAGAIVATRRECSTAMPTTDEVQALLKEVDHV